MRNQKSEKAYMRGKIASRIPSPLIGAGTRAIQLCRLRWVEPYPHCGQKVRWWTLGNDHPHQTEETIGDRSGFRTR